MDDQRLYRYLKESPRDGRWMLRRLGPDYPARVEQLNRLGRPVEVRLEEVDGARRAVYRAADQGELFPAEEQASPPRRARRSTGRGRGGRPR